MSQRSSDGARLRLGFLYPGLGVAEDDISWLVGRLSADAVVPEIVETPIDLDAHTVPALRELGESWRLRAGAQVLRDRGAAVAMWACTSGSFVFGWEGAQRQVQELEEFFGAPSSSTSLAFVRALNALDIRRVAIAATYPDDVTRCFSELLSDAGIEVIACASNNIPTAAAAGLVESQSVIELVCAGDRPDAEAVLVPDTALHTARIGARLCSAAGKPVLTANQVTVWEAFRLCGRDFTAAGLGSLFARSAA